MNVFFHPVYWASLVAIIISQISIVINKWYQKIDGISFDDQALEIGIVILTLAIVVACVFRYYVAVSVNIHTSGRNILSLNMPKFLKRMIFFCLIILLVFANSISGAYATLGQFYAYLFCVMIAILSNLTNALMFIGNQFRPQQLPASNLNFVVADVVYLMLIGFCWFLFASQPDSIDKELAAFLLGVFIALTILVLYHEIQNVFLSLIRSQFAELRDKLAS